MKLKKLMKLKTDVIGEQGLAALALVNFADEYEIEGDRQLEDVDGSGRCRMWYKWTCSVNSRERICLIYGTFWISILSQEAKKLTMRSCCEP